MTDRTPTGDLREEIDKLIRRWHADRATVCDDGCLCGLRTGTLREQIEAAMRRNDFSVVTMADAVLPVVKAWFASGEEQTTESVVSGPALPQVIRPEEHEEQATPLRDQLATALRARMTGDEQAIREDAAAFADALVPVVEAWAAKNFTSPAGSAPAGSPETAPRGEIPADLRERLVDAIDETYTTVDTFDACRAADAVLHIVEAETTALRRELEQLSELHVNVCAYGVDLQKRAEQAEQHSAAQAERVAELTRALDTVHARVEETERQRDAAHGMLERIPDVHMKFGIVGVVEPEDAACADWCFACRLERAEAAVRRVQALVDSYPPGSQFARSGAQALFRATLGTEGRPDETLAAVDAEQPTAAPHPDDTWTVAVEVPLSLPVDLRHDLFTAVASAVRDWEPDNREGWDAEVYGTPTADSLRAWKALAALPDLVRVAGYVSRGRRFVDVEPYPDVLARRALGSLDDATLRAAVHQSEETSDGR
ncbi:hypothetical protein [Actinomadura madurae]|uniref:hypothetical protein n=1 Tax=Actinomadura madurae TaxID=1993 RepID=UPI0020D251BE|nr:hypothetical protein [Actinomadura madurae]MCP9947218.1 hypothetical protein [Actinomadura madurae]MCP9963983.1 hypothetical protein [Actinomadura madurae]MCP9976458.1 hypothetical protein [Actinomadura madurae]MCQ0012049.1 hypothetical protein [Actinomadura madurae]MCQ0012651.1 hypothetical protein [Actinomadura madurae]